MPMRTPCCTFARPTDPIGLYRGFERKPAPDLVRGRHRLASGKRVKTGISEPGSDSIRIKALERCELAGGPGFWYAGRMNLPGEVVEMLGQTLAKVVPVTIALALVFSVLAHFWACNPGRPWWRKRELVTDVCYWFLVPLFARVFRIGLLVLGAALVFGIRDADELIAFYDNGHGPLSRLPLWLQAILFLVAADFMMYWLHRMFHGGGFWKYHAIHHSSEDVDWISAARFHPVNLLLGTIGVDVVLLMAGISPGVMLWLGPFNIFHSAFVHANLNWTLGPFKYVVATPVFHRWHHTCPRGGRRHQFRGHLSALGHPVRDLPDAERHAAGPIWRGRSVLVSPRNHRTAGLSVPQIEHDPENVVAGFPLRQARNAFARNSCSIKHADWRISCPVWRPICPLFMNCRQIHRVGHRFRCVSPLPAC